MENNIIIGSLLAVQLASFYFLNQQDSIIKNNINDNPDKDVIAIAYLNDITSGIKGSVNFYEDQEKDKVIININLSGLPKSALLGFHIHAAGDLSDGCKSACAHFNPFNTVHGGPDSNIRHVGDLGNITTDANGNCIMKFEDRMIKLRGYKQNIIGRSIVIHGKIDDLGLGGDAESLITGNAGARIACAVIGYSKKMTC
jgi:Cu-Zn family superoxide dismutase